MKDRMALAMVEDDRDPLWLAAPCRLSAPVLGERERIQLDRVGRPPSTFNAQRDIAVPLVVRAMTGAEHQDRSIGTCTRALLAFDLSVDAGSDFNGGWYVASSRFFLFQGF